jgi:Ca2+/H+ antiporter, TMEM165/GDT1 family
MVNWTVVNVLTGVFLAAFIEAAETAAQVVLVSRLVERRYRWSALVGAGLAVLVLAGLVLTLGTTLVFFVPIGLFHLIFGASSVLVGATWLRTCILRYAGVLPLRDEQTVSARNASSLQPEAEAEVNSSSSSGWLVGGLLGFKPTLVEGLETLYLVIILGMPQGALTEATAAASAAYFLVGIIAFILWQRSKLVAIPQNTLKCVLSVQMLTLGTVWVGSALGVTWWRENLSYFLVAGIYAAFTFGLVKLLRSHLSKSAAVCAAQAQEQLSAFPATFRVSAPTSATTRAKVTDDTSPTFWEQVLGNNDMGQQEREQEHEYAARRHVGAKAARLTKWLEQTGREVYNLFLGDRLILVGVPPVLITIYLLYYHFTEFAESSYLFVFQNGAILLIGSILGLMTLSCFYYIRRQQHQPDNTGRQSPDNSYPPLLNHEPEPQLISQPEEGVIQVGREDRNVMAASPIMRLTTTSELKLALQAENSVSTSTTLTDNISASPSPSGANLQQYKHL